MEPGTAVIAAGAAGAGSTTAEAAESRPRALGAEEMKPRAAEAAELQPGALGAEGRTPGAEGMAVDAAWAGLAAENAGEMMVEAADAAEEGGRAGKLADGVEKAAWGADDDASEVADDKAAEGADDKAAWGERTAWAGREAPEGKESRAKKLAAESAAVSGAGADEDESGKAGG